MIEMKNNGPWLAALALAAAMPVAADDWIEWRSVDRMTGDEYVWVYAYTHPEEPRPSVYAETEGILVIDCEDREVWFRLNDLEGFLIEFLPHGTANWIEIPIQFDNETFQWLSAYTSGERAILSFDLNFDLLSLAEGRRRLLIEVPSNKGDLYFDFNLTGLHEAHRKHCG